MQNMKITAGLGRLENFSRLVKAGADELFAGFVPLAWLEKYGYCLESVFEHEPEAKAREKEIKRNFKLTNLNGEIAAEKVSREEAEYLLAWAEA